MLPGIKFPGVKVRLVRNKAGRYMAFVMGAGDSVLNDGPELFGRPYVRDLDRAKTLAAELLEVPAERITFEVET